MIILGILIYIAYAFVIYNPTGVDKLFFTFPRKIRESLVLFNLRASLLSSLRDAHKETTIHARIFEATYTSPHFDDRSILTRNPRPPAVSFTALSKDLLASNAKPFRENSSSVEFRAFRKFVMRIIPPV